MKFINFDSVLCLSPHPDDIEFSAGGSIMSSPDTHFDILCLTQGGDCDDTTDIKRNKEVEDFWSLSPTYNFTLLFSDIKYLKEKTTEYWINYIETEFLSKKKYDAILLPSSLDSHFEHCLVSSFGYALARVTAYSLIEYKSPSALETWIPNYFISIDKVYDLKKQMLSQFKSQLDRSYFSEANTDGFHINFQCSKKGLKYVEQFKINTLYNNK